MKCSTCGKGGFKNQRALNMHVNRSHTGRIDPWAGHHRNRSHDQQAAPAIATATVGKVRGRRSNKIGNAYEALNNALTSALSKEGIQNVRNYINGFLGAWRGK